MLHRLLPHARTPKIPEFEVGVEAEGVELGVDVDALGHTGVPLGSGLLAGDQLVPAQANHWQALFS